MDSEVESVDLDAIDSPTEIDKEKKEEVVKEEHKNCDCKKSDPMMAISGNPEGDIDKDEEEDNEGIELSWKNLVRFIA